MINTPEGSMPIHDWSRADANLFHQATWSSWPEDMREAVERGGPLPDEPAEE
jgi:hypothetical protein